MPTHAIAMVKWNVFRPGVGGEPFTRSYFYASRQKRLVNLVGKGGTLWLATSRRRAGEPRHYHLAYKLVDCGPETPSKEISRKFGPHMVVAQSWERSVHFPFNDATKVLLRLNFTSGKPLADPSKIGLRLLSIPQLTKDDVNLLETFQQKVLSERTVFLSYSHRNRRDAAQLERELESRNVHVYRDETALRPGERWMAALARAAQGSDIFMVLVSPAAASSEWVRREVGWATEELKRDGLVKRIIPLVMPSGGWKDFPEVHAFQRIEYPQRPDQAFFDELAEKLGNLPRWR